MPFSSNPWAVQGVDLGQVANSIMQGLQYKTAMEDRARAIAAQQAQMQREGQARQAFAGLSGLPTEEDLMAGYNDQVPPQAPAQGGVPLMSAQNKPQELTPIDMEKLLPTDLNHILDPKNAASERQALDGINHSSENHDDMVGHADQILSAPDNKKGTVVKGIIDQIVANGGDATPYAQLLRMSPTDAANHVKVARDLMERDYIRKIAANDPEMAYKIMQDKIQQRKNDIAQQKADAYQARMLELASGGGPDAVHGNYVTDKGTIGLIMKSGKLVDTGRRTLAGGTSSDLSPDQETLANEIAMGKKAPLTISARAPQNAAIMARVYGINPQYDEKSYKTGQAASTYWSTGKGAQSVIPFNTVVSHLDTMQKIADGLKNGDTQGLNKLYNSIATQFGDPSVTNFEAAKNMIAGEIVKSIVGAGGTGEDRDKIEKVFSAANSADQLKGAIDTARELMAGKLRSVEQEYKASGMQDDFKERMLLPETKRAFYAEQAKQSGVNAPQAAIEHLKQNPSLKDAFDQKYGKGSADKILGAQ